MDQRRQDPRTRSRTAVDEEHEVPDEIWIGEFVQAREEELDAERRLDQRRGCESGVAARRYPTNPSCRRGAGDRLSQGFPNLLNVLPLIFMPFLTKLRTLYIPRAHLMPHVTGSCCARPGR